MHLTGRPFAGPHPFCVYLATRLATHALLLAAMAASLFPRCAHSAPIDVVLSGSGDAYQEALTGLKNGLSGKHELRVITADDVASGKLVNSALIVAVGVNAASAVAALAHETPVLTILVPRQSYEALRWTPTSTGIRQKSALYLDQPIRRHFGLIRVLTPDRSRVGLLLGAAPGTPLEELEAAAKSAGLQLHAQRLRDHGSLIAALRGVLHHSDVLLSLPDPDVVNPANIRHVLLTSYQYRDPVISYSAGYVKAGAMAAVFSTPDQIGRQAGGMVESFLRTGRLPPPQYPSEFTVQINPHVARSLGIEVPDANTAMARLRRNEEGAP
jgi:putative tryptophan/tyrosine transport system substrate-binding protein